MINHSMKNVHNKYLLKMFKIMQENLNNNFTYRKDHLCDQIFHVFFAQIFQHL